MYPTTLCCFLSHELHIRLHDCDQKNVTFCCIPRDPRPNACLKSQPNALWNFLSKFLKQTKSEKTAPSLFLFRTHYLLIPNYFYLAWTNEQFILFLLFLFLYFYFYIISISSTQILNTCGLLMTKIIRPTLILQKNLLHLKV